MGVAAGINMVISLIRTKFAAVLIGTSGVGLLSSFAAVQGLVGTVAGLGIQSSAVREVAIAVGKGDDQAIGRSVLTLRRVCWLTGLAGLVGMMLLSPLISQLTFGSTEYVYDVAALGLIILLGNISGGQMALIQGMRRIGDMAKANVIGAALGALVAIGFYAWLGLRGIVPSLVAIAAITMLISWRFARRVEVPKIIMGWKESLMEAGEMVRLGLVFTWASLMGTGVSYLTVTFITQEISLQAVGIYSAAFALSGLFINFVLEAMAADYYPRLSAASADKNAMNHMANEQIQIGLLLTTPGLLATMVFADWVVHVFYTAEFLPAVELIKWFVFGCLGRVIGFPTGFLILAGKHDGWFMFTQTLYATVHIILIYYGIKYIGLGGVAVAFMIQTVMGILVNRAIIGYLTEFCWLASTFKIMRISVFFMAMGFLFARIGGWMSVLLGVCWVFVSILISIRGILTRLGANHRITRLVMKLPSASRLVPKGL